MKRRALFVGVNEYVDQAIRNLDFSIRDALSLNDIFQQFGYETLALENPSKSDVRIAMRKMTEGLSAGDTFLFYFAGHGWTTATGKHLLFCSDDYYEGIRIDDAGISFDVLAYHTKGDYNRMFVLDACRSDFLSGTRGGDTTTRDLRPLDECVKNVKSKASFAVLRSCSVFEHALEIESRRHGLFTLALMDVLHSARSSSTEVKFSDDFREAVTDKMTQIARDVGIPSEMTQTPEISISGNTQILLEGPVGGISSVRQSVNEAPVLVVCPECGRHVRVEGTFSCKVCGRDHLCLSHASDAPGVCATCAGKNELELRVQKAEAAASRGDYETALRICSEAPERHPRLAFLLGLLYIDGKGVERDLEQAYKWFSCESIYDTNQGRMGRGFVEYNRGNYAEARVLLEASEPEKNKLACFYLGVIYHSGFEVVRDDETAVRWWKLASEDGLADSQANLGLMYRKGWGVEKNEAEAYKWFRKGAEQGHYLACAGLGDSYYNGQGVERDYAEAAKWYSLALQKGYVSVAPVLGRMYEQGLGVNQNHAEAIRFYRVGAEHDCVNSQASLGRLLLSGFGGPQDVDEAAKWLLNAAQKGELTAQLNYAEVCSLKKDYANAAVWLSHAANQGHDGAICRLARLYADGLGVAKDLKESARLYRLAADAGNAEAKWRLAELYYVAVENGDEDSVGVSEIGASVLLREAYDQGEREAAEKVTREYRGKFAAWILRHGRKSRK